LFQTVYYGLIIAAMLLPLITVDIERVPEENDNLDSMMEMMRGTNALCIQRVNEVVDDFVRWDLI
jgi:hypothetical protein